MIRQLSRLCRKYQRFAIGGCFTLGLMLLAQIMPTVQAAVPVRTADSLVNEIGVATHLRYLDTAYGRYEEVIKPRLRELGVRHIRDGGKDPLMFQKMNDLAKLGIKSTLVMDPRDGITPANVIPEVVNPVLPAIAAVEGPNEWDVQRQLTYNGQPFPAGVRLYQTELYNVMKGNPTTRNIQVLMPSLAIPFNAPQLGYLAPLDAGNMHSYAGGNLPSQDLDTKWIPLTKVVSGDKPIVATETGWHTAIADPQPPQAAVSEIAAAKYIPRLFLEYFNRNIQRAFVYELIDERPAPDQENNFGLLRFDGSPKPAFVALKNLITLLKDPGANFQPQPLNYQLSGNLAAVHHTILQKRDRRFYLILWQEVPSFNTQTKTNLVVPEQAITLTLQTPIKQAKAYQPLNSLNPLWQQPTPKTLQLRVPDHPLIIELTPA
ncbi:MAG: hypothetical protein NW220_19970 [Leptolyngbyaceae cyanobacterium bins.349]|nr:hypothetical protein [Leptolyngbyaceae cyanobacterium bins.349]